MIKKYKITSEIEIDVQKIFSEHLENYTENNNIDDEEYTIQSIIDIMNNVYTQQIKDFILNELNIDFKHNKMVDIEIGKQFVDNLKINKV